MALHGGAPLGLYSSRATGENEGSAVETNSLTQRIRCNPGLSLQTQQLKTRCSSGKQLVSFLGIPNVSAGRLPAAYEATATLPGSSITLGAQKVMRLNGKVHQCLKCAKKFRRRYRLEDYHRFQLGRSAESGRWTTFQRFGGLSCASPRRQLI